MKWHIIGGTSYIAQRLIPRLEGFQYACYGRKKTGDQLYLDLTSVDPVVFDNISEGDFVVFFAAVSSPDICQNQLEFAYNLNVVCTESFIKNCIRKGARVLFFSSDTVIGKTSSVADEDSEPAPVGNYAKMKRRVELDLKSEKNLKVFRLSYVFSCRDKFTRYLIECDKTGEVAEVYDALYRNVVYIEDLIDAIIALSKSFDKWDNQIFHICGDELLSRKDLAETFCREFDNSLRYITSIPDDSFFEARPNVIEIKSKFFMKLLGRAPTKIAEAMRLESERVNK